MGGEVHCDVLGGDCGFDMNARKLISMASCALVGMLVFGCIPALAASRGVVGFFGGTGVAGGLLHRRVVSRSTKRPGMCMSSMAATIVCRSSARVAPSFARGAWVSSPSVRTAVGSRV